MYQRQFVSCIAYDSNKHCVYVGGNGCHVSRIDLKHEDALGDKFTEEHAAFKAVANVEPPANVEVP
jgi:hypothetical protein